RRRKAAPSGPRRTPASSRSRRTSSARSCAGSVRGKVWRRSRTTKPTTRREPCPGSLNRESANPETSWGPWSRRKDHDDGSAIRALQQVSRHRGIQHHGNSRRCLLPIRLPHHHGDRGSEEGPHGPYEPPSPLGPYRGPRSLPRGGAFAGLDATFLPPHLPRITGRCRPTHRSRAARVVRSPILGAESSVGGLHAEALPERPDSLGHGIPLPGRNARGRPP